MEVIFLKNHLHNTKGDKEKMSKERSNYLVRMGVVAEYKELKEPVSSKLKKPRKDGVSSVSTPDDHDSYIKSQNKEL